MLIHSSMYMTTRQLLRTLLVGVLFASVSWLQAEPQPASSPDAAAEGKQGTRSVSEWLMRMHEASRRRAYIGTFVVSAEGSMSSAKIWHVCDGVQQIERVESLTGVPRSTFRHNDQVITFLPDSKVAVSEKRESLGLFPNLLKANDFSIPKFYSAKQTGSERVAGFDADVVLLKPKDSLRFGYRVWSEKKTGLVIKLETLDVDGRVLEQAAFSDLEMDAPVSMSKLSKMMEHTDGYRVEKPSLAKTTAKAEGWALKTEVPGFHAMSCYKRSVAADGNPAPMGTVQWVFSDGLASVSLFVDAFDPRRHGKEGVMSMGATQMLTQRLQDWWLTVVGEVPPQTLQAFAQGLERRK